MGPSKGIFFMLVLLGIFVYLSSQCHTDPKYIVQGVKPILSPPFGTKKTKKRLGYFHLHSVHGSHIKNSANIKLGSFLSNPS